MNYSSLNLNAISFVLYPSASKLSGNFNNSKLAVMIYFGCNLLSFCLITCNLVCSHHPQRGVKTTVCANYRKPVLQATLSQSQKQPTMTFSTISIPPSPQRVTSCDYIHFKACWNKLRFHNGFDWTGLSL